MCSNARAAGSTTTCAQSISHLLCITSGKGGFCQQAFCHSHDVTQLRTHTQGVHPAHMKPAIQLYMLCVDCELVVSISMHACMHWMLCLSVVELCTVSMHICCAHMLSSMTRRACRCDASYCGLRQPVYPSNLELSLKLKQATCLIPATCPGMQ